MACCSDCSPLVFFFFFSNDTATTEIYTLSLHDALLICGLGMESGLYQPFCPALDEYRSEEHTSELQSPCNLVCRLLLEKKKTQQDTIAEPVLTRDTTLRDAHCGAP